MTQGYPSNDFSDTFLRSFADREFSAQERRLLLKALQLLDANEQHPSMRVHLLQGAEAGIWSASASRDVRITFLRRESGRKYVLVCSRHYAR